MKDLFHSVRFGISCCVVIKLKFSVRTSLLCRVLPSVHSPHWYGMGYSYLLGFQVSLPEVLSFTVCEFPDKLPISPVVFSPLHGHF